jgi:hypothetical protein
MLQPFKNEKDITLLQAVQGLQTKCVLLLAVAGGFPFHGYITKSFI